MNIVFHSNQLSIRGTETALYDYAHYNETLLGNVSYIMAPANSDMASYEKFLQRFGDRVILYTDFFSESQKLVQENNIEAAYFIKAGHEDGKTIPGIKNIVHAVFDASTPHGDVYVAVSSWLGKKHGVDFLPHIVSLPKVIQDYRPFLNIPENAIVIGRYGGYDQLDVPYVGEAIYRTAEGAGVYFLLMNTRPITPPSDKIIYLDATYDLEEKAAFLNTCDAFLHGRTEGESFGLSICEALSFNLPVITNITCRDRNHIEVLGDKGLYYDSLPELIGILANFERSSFNYSSLVDPFSPEKVIEKFNKLITNE